MITKSLAQSWPAPAEPRPIIIIGAGDIVNDAHLPAYRKAGFDVVGLYDLHRHRAEELSKEWNIPTVFSDLSEATTGGVNYVYDIATPPAAFPQILEMLPEGAPLLMQKPMGVDLSSARTIREICKRNKLIAAVNFQLRFSPMMLAIRDAVQRNLLGDIMDIEVHINILTPWESFPFLKNMDRVEIAVHSIHYLDLIRSLVGVPKSVFARSLPDKRIPDFKQTRTSIILDYGDSPRVVLSVNHNHDFGERFQTASIRFEGDKGCMLAKIGVLLDYPNGKPDELWLYGPEKSWEQIQLQGSWFPDAFIGVMSNLQRFYSSEDALLYSRVDDAYETMSLVEACYNSFSMEAALLPLD